MKPIGLIAAMAQESRSLLQRVGRAKRVRVGAFGGYTFEMSGQTCVLVTSGMGMLRAGEATRSLLEQETPRLLISFGIAGGVECDLEIGDVVCAGSVCLLVGGVPGLFQPLTPWPEVSSQAMQRALAGRGAHLYAGTAITTSGSQLSRDLTVDMRHPVLEMETAGIAQASVQHGIPLLSIRSISDGPRAPLPVNLEELLDENARLRTGKLIQVLVRHPGILLLSRQLMINTQLAADNAAAAVIAGLEGMAAGQVA